MFDNEDDDFMGYRELDRDMKKFEEYLEGKHDSIFFDSDKWELLLDQYVIQGQYKIALKCAKEALSQFPFNQSLKIRKAQAYSSMGKLKEALNLLSEVDESTVDKFELYSTKGAVFSQLKDSKNAIKFYRLALEHAEKEDKDELFIELAMEYELNNDAETAIEILKEAIRYNPENESAFYELAYLYDWVGGYDDMVKCYEEFIDRYPYSYTAWYNLGNTYNRFEEYEQAVWAYEYVVVIKEDFGPVYYHLGSAYMEIDRYQDAIEAFERNMKLEGEEALTFAYIGECYEQLGEIDSARFNYKKSLEIAPLLPEGWLGLGILEDLEGRTKEGIVLIQKASELDPENSGIYHVLAGAYEKIEDLDQAVFYYEKSLELDNSDSECLSNYMKLKMQFGIRESLDYLYEKRFLGNDMYWVYIVGLLWQLDRREEALKEAKQAVQMIEEGFIELLFEEFPALSGVPEFVLLGE